MVLLSQWFCRHRVRVPSRVWLPPTFGPTKPRRSFNQICSPSDIEVGCYDAQNEDPQGNQKAIPLDRKWQSKAPRCRYQPLGDRYEPKAKTQLARYAYAQQDHVAPNPSCTWKEQRLNPETLVIRSIGDVVPTDPCPWAQNGGSQGTAA